LKGLEKTISVPDVNSASISAIVTLCFWHF